MASTQLSGSCFAQVPGTMGTSWKARQADLRDGKLVITDPAGKAPAVTVFDHAVHNSVVSSEAGMTAKKPYCFSVRHKDSGDAKLPVYAVDTRDGLTEWLLMIARSNVSILPPEFRSPGGTFEGGLNVFIDCDTPGTSIVFDLEPEDSSPPSSAEDWKRPKGGGKYVAGQGIPLKPSGASGAGEKTTYTVRAVAYMKGCPDSACVSATFTILPAVPDGGPALFKYLAAKLAHNVAHGSDRGEAYHITMKSLRLFRDDILDGPADSAITLPEVVPDLLRVCESLPNVVKNAAQAESALEVSEDIAVKMKEGGLLQDSMALLQHCIALQTIVLDKTTGARSFDGSVVSGQRSSKRAPKPWGSSADRPSGQRSGSPGDRGGKTPSGKSKTSSGKRSKSRERVEDGTESKTGSKRSVSKKRSKSKERVDPAAAAGGGGGGGGGGGEKGGGGGSGGGQPDSPTAALSSEPKPASPTAGAADSAGKVRSAAPKDIPRSGKARKAFTHADPRLLTVAEGEPLTITGFRKEYLLATVVGTGAKGADGVESGGRFGAIPPSVFPLGKTLLAQLTEEAVSLASTAVVASLALAADTDDNKAARKVGARVSARASSRRERKWQYQPLPFDLDENNKDVAMTGCACFRHIHGQKAGHSVSAGRLALSPDMKSLILTKIEDAQDPATAEAAAAAAVESKSKSGGGGGGSKKSGRSATPPKQAGGGPRRPSGGGGKDSTSFPLSRFSYIMLGPGSKVFKTRDPLLFPGQLCLSLIIKGTLTVDLSFHTCSDALVWYHVVQALMSNMTEDVIVHPSQAHWELLSLLIAHKAILLGCSRLQALATILTEIPQQIAARAERGGEELVIQDAQSAAEHAGRSAAEVVRSVTGEDAAGGAKSRLDGLASQVGGLRFTSAASDSSAEVDASGAAAVPEVAWGKVSTDSVPSAAVDQCKAVQDENEVVEGDAAKAKSAVAVAAAEESTATAKEQAAVVRRVRKAQEKWPIDRATEPDVPKAVTAVTEEVAAKTATVADFLATGRLVPAESAAAAELAAEAVKRAETMQTAIAGELMAGWPAEIFELVEPPEPEPEVEEAAPAPTTGADEQEEDEDEQQADEVPAEVAAEAAAEAAAAEAAEAAADLAESLRRPKAKGVAAAPLDGAARVTAKYGAA